ncbi:MAG: helix-turn-helix domain-containing protein [Eubacteriales bacterium]|nr:helix-turn-helix domain-containing protein [Eubacteriales bacterium]
MAKAEVSRLLQKKPPECYKAGLAGAHNFQVMLNKNIKSAPQRAVLMELYFNKDKTIYITNSLLQERCNLNQPQVSKALKELQDSGWLTVTDTEIMLNFIVEFTLSNKKSDDNNISTEYIKNNNISQGYVKDDINISTRYNNISTGYNNISEGYNNISQGYNNISQGYIKTAETPEAVSVEECHKNNNKNNNKKSNKNIDFRLHFYQFFDRFNPDAQEALKYFLLDKETEGKDITLEYLQSIVDVFDEYPRHMHPAMVNEAKANGWYKIYPPKKVVKSELERHLEKYPLMNGKI